MIEKMLNAIESLKSNILGSNRLMKSNLTLDFHCSYCMLSIRILFFQMLCVITVSIKPYCKSVGRKPNKSLQLHFRDITDWDFKAQCSQHLYIKNISYIQLYHLWQSKKRALRLTFIPVMADNDCDCVSELQLSEKGPLSCLFSQSRATIIL